MKKCSVLFLLLCVTALIPGCPQPEPEPRGDMCAGASFVWPDEAGMVVLPGENSTYDYYTTNKYCPPDHPMCLKQHGVVYRGMIDENGEYTGDIVVPDKWYCSDRKESCPKDSHLVKDGMYCELDSARHCGSDDNNCMDSAKGVESAECVNGQCQVLKCLQGFALIDGECRTGAQCCGDYCKNCTLAQPRQVCTTEDSLSFDCGAGCALHNMIECMGVCIDPDSSLSFCGTDEAEDGMCRMHYCPDMEGWRNGRCIKGVCQVSECIRGYHTVAEADGVTHCEPDSNEVCGARLDDCTQIANAETVSCELGFCAIKTCEYGYTLYDNRCIEYEGEICGVFVCGPHAHCDRDTQRCKCDSGYADCEGVCYDLNSSAYHCGSCSNVCTSDRVSHSTALECVNGTCEVAACENGYHPEDARCLSNKCENGTTDCIHKDKIGQVRTCVDGVWSEPHSCDNSSCNNDIENCGMCINGTTKCESDVHYTCKNGRWQNAQMCEAPQICTLDGCISCNAGEHLNGDSCEKDDLNNCGAHAHRCENPSNAKPSCDKGSCTYTCNDGFENSDGDWTNGCELDKSLHITSIGTCEDGYADCDNNKNNGCEIHLAASGRKDCSTCADGFTKCGTDKDSNNLPLCFNISPNVDLHIRKEDCGSYCNNDSGVQITNPDGTKITPAKCESGQWCHRSGSNGVKVVCE